MATEFSPELNRRTGWWIVAAVMIGIVGLFFLSFIGTFIFGLFVYYGARPINRRIQHRADSRAVAATVTLLFIVLPTLALLGYTGFVAFREFTTFLGPETIDTALERVPAISSHSVQRSRTYHGSPNSLVRSRGSRRDSSEPWVRSARFRTRCST